jgi:hypothetical protein
LPAPLPAVSPAYNILFFIAYRGHNADEKISARKFDYKEQKVKLRKKNLPNFQEGGLIL